MVAFTDARINESSSAAMSYAVPTAFWTNNDENTTPHAFLVDTATGNTIGTFNWSDTGGMDDPEAMCVDQQGRLWWADIGDNDQDRDHASIYMRPDPGAGTHGTLSGDRYTIQYPQGPQQAECFIINPVTNARYIVTKETNRLYQLPATLLTGGRSVKNVLTLLSGGMPSGVSDGTFSIDGRYVLFARDGDPTNVLIYSADTWSYAGSIPVTSQPDREGITMALDGLSFWTTSEGALSTFVHTPLPQQFWPSSVVDGYPGPIPSNPCG